jgi:hypothetical protein
VRFRQNSVVFDDRFVLAGRRDGHGFDASRAFVQSGQSAQNESERDAKPSTREGEAEAAEATLILLLMLLLLRF